MTASGSTRSTAFEATVPCPTGLVTFLFTDIEGSTAFWDHYPERMRVALARHDRLLRRAIGSYDGYIVKTTGDGLYAAFANARNAIGASLAAQRSLQNPGTDPGHSTEAPGAELPLTIRIGIHTGAAECRDGDYFGSVVNRTARIMSIAHGGQILLSAGTAELVSEGLPEGVTLRDLGEHRLKGLLSPERILQVMAPGLRADFPPLASLTGHNLPADRDEFIGRGESLAELQRRLDGSARLISVVGLGGTGKTRLVIQFGRGGLRNFPGGVWFCDLSEARNVEGVLRSVAQALDVPLGTADPVVQLGQSIAGRGRCLVILDNFEQVARHAEETLGRWLDLVAEARFLVTTREVLGLRGEEVLPLGPMTPSDAAHLFVRRAQAAKPGFQPSNEDQSSIEPLVRLLDGLPLAIELAAARVRVMPPKTLVARVSERFKLLASTGGRLDRQATLRTVFDWSWELLSVPEKAALAQLSVFAGGFSLESAEAVLDLSAYDDAPWAVDVLQSLVQKSLVRQMSNDRFDLLVSVQEYGAEQLRTPQRYPGSGPASLTAAEVRHGMHFSAFDEAAATAEGCIELDNLVIACRRALAHGDSDTAVRTLEAAWAALALRGPFGVGVELASAVRAMDGIGRPVAPRVDYVAGRALQLSGKAGEARVLLERSRSEARDLRDSTCECRALIALAFLDLHEGNLETARANAHAALSIASELRDWNLQSEAHNLSGNLESVSGQRNEAKAHYEAALLSARQARNRRREGAVLGNLATEFVEMGVMDQARAHNEAALTVARELGDRRLEGNTLCNLGLLHQLQGRSDEALDPLEAAVTVARDMGNALLESIALCNLGIVYESLTRFEEARTHFEAALVITRATADRRGEGQVLSYLGLLHARRGSFDDARRCLDASESLLQAVGDQMSLGILHCSRAEAAHLEGASDAASAALREANRIAADIAAGPESELGLALARVRQLLGPRHGGGVGRSRGD